MSTTFLRGLVAAVATAFCLGATGLAAGETATTERTQVPGYWRLAVGDTVVTALYDGYIYIPTRSYAQTTPERAQALYAQSFEADPRGAPVSVNAYIVRTGGKLVMIDAGTAKCFGPSMGRLPDSLHAAGFAPEDVDTILITHMHGDHVCGLTANGQRLFPKAEVWAAEAEAGLWFDDTKAAAAAPKWKGYFQTAQSALAPYRTAGKFHTFKPGQTVVAGIVPVATPGHTPGHTSYRLVSKGQSLLMWGDIVHGVALQFAEPQATILSDFDPQQAAATRAVLMKTVAADRETIAGAHLPFPGFGHVRRDGTGYAFVPLEYGPVTAAETAP